MTDTLLFDVNETLLDLAALEPFFARVFSDPHERQPWFRKVLECAMVGELTGEYRSFSVYSIAALEIQAQLRGVALSAADIAEFRATIRHVPAHPDVPGALEQLRQAGFKLVAFTNSPLELVEAQLTHAGIRPMFDAVLSVEQAQHLKPHPLVYAYAGAALALPVTALRLIAGHDWDIRGAMRAGMRGAFVVRPGLPWNPLYERPDVWGNGLGEVAAQIVARATISQPTARA